MIVVDSTSKTCLAGRLFVPKIGKSLKWGCIKMKQKTSTVITKTLHSLNLMMFFFCYHFYINIFLLIFMGHERQELKQ